MRPLLARLPSSIKRLAHKVRVALIKRRQVGAGTYIDPTAQVLGWAHTRIGKHTTICEGTCINVNHRQPGQLSVIIGDNCFIGRRNFFTSGQSIELKDYCFTGIGCQFIGAGHSFAEPFRPYLTAEVESYGRIMLGVNCWLTNNVIVLKNVSIGFGTVVGANSLVTHSLPPLCVAVGQPAHIIQLFNLATHRWEAVDDTSAEFNTVFQAHLAQLPAEDDYRQQLVAVYPHVAIPSAVAGIAGGEV